MKGAIVTQTLIGRRPTNQDRLGHWRTSDALLIAAADGMGGHAHGEYAAEFALGYLGAGFRRDARPGLAAPGDFLRRSFVGAHAALIREAQVFGLEDTPRTTIVACVVQQGWAWWAHAGDSRLYLVRNGRIAAQTVDHTMVQQWVEQGLLQPAQVRGHPQRNLLLQCLGGARPPRIEAVGRARLERDDIVLLCTDGFWEPLHDRQIVAGVESGSAAEGLARLAGLARERAGTESDNISALALAWDDAAVPLGEGAAPGPRLEPLDAGEEIDAPDPDILRALLEDPDAGVARMRRSLEQERPA